MKWFGIFTLVIVSFFPLAASSQNFIQKVSKQILNEYDTPFESIFVQCEKANIEVFGWDESYTKVTLTPISRHTEKEVAIHDLQYIKYYSFVENKKLIVKNLFYGKGQNITSNLSIDIQVCVPKHIPISINNLYGSVSCSNLNNLTTSIAFGRLDVIGLSGSALLKVKYTNTSIKNTKGNLKIVSEKSDLSIDQLWAKTQCDSKYGSLSVHSIDKQSSLSFSGHNTPVVISTPNFHDFNYKIQVLNGRILCPYYIEKRVKTFNRINNPQYNTIDISTSNKEIEITNSHEKN